MKMPGWQLVKKHVLVCIAMMFIVAHASAASLTVRDIQIKENKIEIQLDGNAPKGAIELDYVRDIVQFSVQNSTIYPAKILHSENQAFTKVFAYQYAPNLVRVRFSVDGQADSYRGKVKWAQQGKAITITFPEGKIAAAPKTTTKDSAKEAPSNEGSLLAKVLGTSKPADIKAVDAKTDSKSTQQKTETAKTDGKTATKSEKLTGKTREAQSGEGQTLGGAKGGTSPFRAFLAMFLVVGGLGLVLFYVKKKQKGGQASRVGDNWLSNLLPQGMRKQKSLIEIVAQHPLGPKQSITVIRIRGQQFVLGVTQDNVQLISQLDVDEAELELLEDPAVAASIGKIFGGKPRVEPTSSFGALLKNSPDVPQKLKTASAPPAATNGAASSVMGRNAYQVSTPAASQVSSQTLTQGLTQIPVIQAQQSGIRDQIRRRLEGMKNV